MHKCNSLTQTNIAIRIGAALLATCGLLASWSWADDKPAKKWNILFLLSDDMRPELACYGAPTKTPHLDSLAAAGVRFERAYCQYPLCNPSRTSLLTGHHPDRTGVYENATHFRSLHPDWVTLPQHFKNHDYATLGCGKIFHGGLDDEASWSEVAPRPAGATGKAKADLTPAQRAVASDRRVVLEDDGQSHNDYRTADRAIAWLDQYKGRTFFLACGFTKPHSPPSAPQAFYDLYPPDKIVLPSDFAPRPTPPAGFPAASLPTRNGDLFAGRDASPDEARLVIQAYRASLSWTDWNVGRVLTALDRHGLRDKTVIVFWGDHGYHLGEKGKWLKHQSLWEVGDRVPLIVVVPGAKGNGRSSARIVQTLDIYPTLSELCGLTPPAGLEGHSLVSLLNDPRAEWIYPAYTRAGDAKKYAATVRTERWRYSEFGANGADGVMLIDEQADPGETKNLADDPTRANVREELQALLKHLATGK